MEPAHFRAATLLLLLAYVLHRGYYTRKVRHAAEAVVETPRPGRLTQIANPLAPLALLATALYVFYPPWMAWAALPLPGWLRWAGLGLAAAGFGVLQWAQVTLGANWSDEPMFVKGQVLVTHGLYRWVRHPIYAGMLLILGSLLLVSANACVGALWLVLAVLGSWDRMLGEEALMLKQFGDEYSAYMRRTGRVVPRLWEE